ncbi:hypothetical protein CVT26_003365 [Gymnopilus dilepis]|uniref:Uncharacterized protein n=1 Tax=Gymnopilus dilepis TaxID=231916 RepID=A0A409VQT0_9AGAR|nr:hypothetical protein CVT26_003365 [Gymnopilus dilepis]
MEGEVGSHTSPLARPRQARDVSEEVRLLCQEIWRMTDDILLMTKGSEVAAELERVGLVTAWSVAEVQRIPSDFLPPVHYLLKRYKWTLRVIRDKLPMEPLSSKLLTGFGMRHVDSFIELFQDTLSRIPTLSYSQSVSSAHR